MKLATEGKNSASVRKFRDEGRTELTVNQVAPGECIILFMSEMN